MKKGITLISLMVTIILMVIITTVVVISGSNIKDTTYIKSFATEMFSVKELVKDYEFMYDKYPVKDETIELDLNLVPAECRSQFEGEDVINNKISFLKLDYAKTGIRELNRGMGKLSDLDIYVYSVKTNKIYYLQGEKIDNYTYYTLTAKLYKEIGINEIN